MSGGSNNLESIELEHPFGPSERKVWSNRLRIFAALIGLFGIMLYNSEAVFLLVAIGGYLLVAAGFMLAERYRVSERFRLITFLFLDAGIITLACYAFGTQYSKIAMFYSVYLIGYLLEQGHKWGFIALLLALSLFLLVMLLEKNGAIPVAPYVQDRQHVLNSPDRLIPNFSVVTLCLTIAYILMTFTLVRLKQHMKNERQLLISKWAAQQQAAKLQKRLDETYRLEGLGRLAGGVAHDFNNLLTCILGYSRGIYQDLETSSPIREDIKEVIHAAEGAAHLTKQLLAFSRKQIIKPQIIDLSDLVSNLERMLSRIIGEDIDFKVDIKNKNNLIEADPSQIEQVIINLVANARDAMPSGGILTATVDHASLKEPESLEKYGLEGGDYVSLTVSDTGHGMEPETRSRVFEPFFTTKERGKGTGLGLATVYGIVKQNGGAIHVYSTPGKGTSFCVHLKKVAQNGNGDPENSVKTFFDGNRAKQRDSHAKVTEMPSEAKQKIRMPQINSIATILVVEDEEMVRRVTTRILRGQGYRIIEASSGEDALQKVSDLGQNGELVRQVDLLLTDVIMPGMSGKALADDLTKRDPFLKVLFMSGYSGDAIAKHGILNPEISFLEKPFTAETLIKMVRSLLDRPLASFSHLSS